MVRSTLTWNLAGWCDRITRNMNMKTENDAYSMILVNDWMVGISIRMTLQYDYDTNTLKTKTKKLNFLVLLRII